MNEDRVYSLVFNLTGELLADDEGVSERSYGLLLALVEEVMGEDFATDLDFTVEATDGRFYAIRDEPQVATVEDLGAALDEWEAEAEEDEEDEEPAFDLYDDRAD